MRKAGLALQSPVRCFSGCFSSHFELKSHLTPAPHCRQPRHSFKAGLSQGSQEQQAEGGFCPRSTCQPHGTDNFWYWEGLASGKPSMRWESASTMVLWLPGKQWYRTAYGGQVRDALSSEPCSACSKLSLVWGMC